MIFAELPIGAKFRFHRRGRLLTKTKQGYLDPLNGEPKAVSADTEVHAEDDDSPLPPAPPKADDAAVLSKALDDLEAASGKTAELAAARQALRRLAALARLKAGG